MKKTISHLFTLLCLFLSPNLLFAQNSPLDDGSIIGSIGIGYSGSHISYSGINYSNASFEPKIGLGFSYFASIDYSINERFSVGLGLNGTHSHAEFILDPSVGDDQVMGYLDKGNVSSVRTVLRITYSSVRDGIRPFARMAIGQFQEQAEMGDVPLKLTENVETEMFPDFKYDGLGILPELGVHQKSFSFSVAYSIPFGELKGEEVPEGFESAGKMTLQGVQVNVCYRIALF
ncbi:MAG: hypothetical protein HKN45_05865 [Flavobacteriales bacterium]|nr:hypothetical protein [Flavobacteriales bacterium]